ncbi:zinc finger BED domain-containing protein 4-like [Garra rufa]|uniref:zinc finger BED domain-containing protein 4-like n=1 Tax=Garra rufa TaxID=137080 RepID=UPI003CCE8A42
MAEQKSNPVWQHFTGPTSGKARCNICNGMVSLGAEKGRKKNTSNLWSHLSCHHLQAYKDAQKEKDKAAASASTANVSQPTLTEMFDAQRKWQNSDPRSKKLDTLVTEMIATDNQPFTFVSGIGFRRLVAAMEPRYNLKTEKHYRTDILDGIVAKVEKKIKVLIAEDAGPFLSFTTDCWSGETEALMSLTCHFIDDNWERKQVVLNAKAMSGSHTGEYISNLFISLLKYWDISHDRVVLVLVKLKNIAKHFNHSVLAKQNLKKIQKELGLPQHSLIQSEPTRWNSTLHMLEQKRALNIYAGEYGKIATPAADQWDIVSNLIDTLEPVEEVTLEISRAEASISSVIPNIAVLKMVLQAEGPNTRGIKTLRDTMLQSLQKRFARMEETKYLVLATLLDPRYKGHVFFAVDTLTKAKQCIKEEYAIVSEQLKTASTEDQGSDPKQRRVEDEELPPTQESDDEHHISEQLDQYLCEPLIDRKTGQPLEWWKQNTSRLHHLAPLARKFLCPPLSSVPSERVFSEIGNIYDNKRSRLTGEHAEQLCFLHYNLPFLNWEY